MIQVKEIEKLKDAFIGAFEGGSTYWANVKDKTPKKVDVAYGECTSVRWFHHILEGGSMDIYDAECESELLGTVTFEGLKAAPKKLENEVERMYLDYKYQRGDCYTDDAILQLSIFDRLIFG